MKNFVAVLWGLFVWVSLPSYLQIQGEVDFNGHLVTNLRPDIQLSRQGISQVNFTDPKLPMAPFLPNSNPLCLIVFDVCLVCSGVFGVDNKNNEKHLFILGVDDEEENCRIQIVRINVKHRSRQDPPRRTSVNALRSRQRVIQGGEVDVSSLRGIHEVVLAHLILSQLEQDQVCP